MGKSINLIAGDTIPPITIDIRKNNAPLGVVPGKYRIEVKILYPDGTIETTQRVFSVRLKTRMTAPKRKIG